MYALALSYWLKCPEILPFYFCPEVTLEAAETKTHREIHSLWGVFATTHRIVLVHLILFFSGVWILAAIIGDANANAKNAQSSRLTLAGFCLIEALHSFTTGSMKIENREAFCKNLRCCCRRPRTFGWSSAFTWHQWRRTFRCSGIGGATPCAAMVLCSLASHRTNSGCLYEVHHLSQSKYRSSYVVTRKPRQR